MCETEGILTAHSEDCFEVGMKACGANTKPAQKTVPLMLLLMMAATATVVIR